MNHQHQQKRKIRQSCRRNAVPNRFSSRFSTSRTNAPRLLSQPKAGTHSPSPTGSHTAAYTPKQGPSGQGRYHYPRRIPHVHEHPRAGCQNGKLCRFWVLAGGALPKNAESLRSSDALMRVAAPRRRGPAGLRNLFRFCRNRDLYIRRSWFSACARWGWYYYPRSVSHGSEALRGRGLK